MNTSLKSSLIGFTGGLASIIGLSALSGGVEIFDDRLGSYLLEAILSILVIFIALRYTSFVNVILLLIFAYIGVNVGLYLIGSEEQRLYFQIGLFWSLFFFKSPAIAGVVAYMIKKMLSANNRETEQDVS